jgi:hypothetical protein
MLPGNKREQGDTYQHRFKDGTTATLTLPPFNVEWSVLPTAKIVPEYLAWRHSCFADFTERTGLRVLLVDMLPSGKLHGTPLSAPLDRGFAWAALCFYETPK